MPDRIIPRWTTAVQVAVVVLALMTLTALVPQLRFWERLKPLGR